MKRNLIPMFKPYIPNDIDMNIPLAADNITFGLFGEKFENDLRNFLNNKYTLTITNFNTAYFILLQTLGLKVDDEVLVSPLACLESIQPLKAYGLKIKFIDVDSRTGLITVEEVQKALTPSSKLLVINHYLGNISQIDQLHGFAYENGLQVINDCIEAFGGKFEGKYLGDLRMNSNFIFNFSAVRIPNTVTGAAISTYREDLFTRMTKVRDNGIDRKCFRKLDGEINEQHDITFVGYSGMMNELSSYLGYIQMKEIKSILKARKNVVQKWKNVLENYFPEVDDSFYDLRNSESNYWVFGFHSNNVELTKNKLYKIGFSCSQVHLNNNVYSLFDKKELNNVSSFMKSFISVPTGWWFSEKLLDDDNIKKIIGY